MADTIKLPPLPESFPAGYIARTEYFYTAAQVRAIQLETAKDVQEACAREMEKVFGGHLIYGYPVGETLRKLEFDV